MGCVRRLDVIVVCLLAATLISGIGIAIVSFQSLLRRNTAEQLIAAINGKGLQRGLQKAAAHQSLGEIPKAPVVKRDFLVPVLLIAATRPNVSRAIDHILSYEAQWRQRQLGKPKLTQSISHFPLITSVDGSDQATASVIKRYSTAGQLVHLQHPVLDPPQLPPQDKDHKAYYLLSRHYKWALEQVFDVLGFEYAIILEDDMEISPDFFDYFDAFLPLLRTDTSLMCISSWNDNGKTFQVNATDMFFRSDFFPGLGWMMGKDLWRELKPKWPAAHWDDWLRKEANRKGRACIRPEVSRNFNFGDKGASGGQFYTEHIATNVPNKEPVNYSGIDVMQYRRDRYDPVYLTQVYRLSVPATTAQLMALQQDRNLAANPLYFTNPNALLSEADAQKETGPASHPALHPNTPMYCGRHCLRRYTVQYAFNGTYEGFVAEATRWRLMPDIREGTPRGAYLGIVCFKAQFKYPRPRTLFHMTPEAAFNNTSTSSRSLLAAHQQGKGGSSVLTQQGSQPHGTISSSSISSGASKQRFAVAAAGEKVQQKGGRYYRPVVVDDVVESHFQVCLAPPLSPAHQRFGRWQGEQLKG